MLDFMYNKKRDSFESRFLCYDRSKRSEITGIVVGAAKAERSNRTWTVRSKAKLRA